MKFYINILFVILFSPLVLMAQTESFSLNDCITYALENSTDISIAQNSIRSNEVNLSQSKAERYPTLNLGANQQFSSKSNYNEVDDSWSNKTDGSFTASLNTELSLYNGAKIKNTIKQNEINLNVSQVNIQTQQELLSLNVLSAYIDVLLAKENARNNQLQLEAIQKQLSYAEARKQAGNIALSDLLNIKSQVATNKSGCTEAESNLRVALVTLMQMMNMPVNNSFDIDTVSIDMNRLSLVDTDPINVYNIALDIQPGIEMAQLNIESAEQAIKISKADGLPSLNLRGGLQTVYGSNLNGVDYGEQLSNGTNPYIGLNLSVPIFQNKKTKTQVELAKIQLSNTELELVEQKNNLRKYIEQACTDAQTAQSNYLALQEQLEAEQESYNVASEMFSQGMVNAVDFLLSKNNLIIAENKFTQAKYNLILQNKIVEYYLGKPIKL